MDDSYRADFWREDPEHIATRAKLQEALDEFGEARRCVKARLKLENGESVELQDLELLFRSVNAEGQRKFAEIRSDADDLAVCVANYIAGVYFSLSEKGRRELHKSSFTRQEEEAVTYYRQFNGFFDEVEEVDSQIKKIIRHFDERMFHEKWFAVRRNYVHRKVNETLKDLGVDVFVSFQGVLSIKVE